MVKYIFLLVFISGLFCACEHDEVPGGRSDEPAEGAVPVNFKLQLSGAPDIETGTGYLPMTKADGTMKSGLSKNYKYVLLKKIEDSWYIEQIEDAQLKNITPGYHTYWDIEVRNDGPIGDLSMELRPGTYKLTVFLNSRSMDWDKKLKPGDRVYTEGKADEQYPCICRYFRDSYDSDYISHSRELFTGSVDFIVEKNGDLHTEAPGREPAITLTRKVGQFQVLLKKTEGNGPNDFSFRHTAYSLKAIFHAREGYAFCEGLDVTGMPYTDPDNPWKEFPLFASTSSLGNYTWRTDRDGRKYWMVELNSTHAALYIIADPDQPEGIPYTIEIVSFTGPSQEYPDFFYYEGEPLTGILKINSVSGIALECVQPQENKVKVGVATDGNGRPLAPEEYLLSPDYPWNQDQYIIEVNE